ncbi:hypothetical protein HO173_001922 [Letharia columbiana]|uniref:Uncharacterized protein n=1 Tax=Letharia columbiana TaxID=112416 RepID=A0A8H6L9C4_9LECA|nr:uncharacterized protein HO173_001922 [Letharia columbiana]KAF6240311.1 hypothetical protein HO173_001922 [Letharia columbiana]
MGSDAIFDLCLPVLEDNTLEEEEKTEKLEELVQKELSLSGQPLEDAVLSILWRYRDSKVTSVASPPVRHTIIRRNSPAPWQIPRSSTPVSPALSRASPAPPPGFGAVPSAFMRTKSYGGSPFGSPRPSPRLAFASPIPHSPSLNSYEFSEPHVERNEYGDYGSDTVDWLVNDDSTSRPSSSGAGSASESGLNAAAASWIQPQQNEMSPYDMLRSVMGDGKSDEEIEGALEASGYDLSATLMNLMGTKGGYQQEQSYFSENDGQILIGKSMMPSEPITIDQTEHGRSNIVCKYWLSNGNCLRADCRFSHDLSSHICKYWVMGNCLAGDSCIFSHDPALLMKSMNLGDAAIGTPPSQLHPSFQVQDYDTFPALQAPAINQWTQSSSPSQINSYNSSVSQGSNSYMSTPRRHFEARTSSMNGTSSSYGSPNSRPTSRHRSRDPTPSPAIPAVDDTEAFPSLGAAGIKVVKKHHGKRGGHGHGHNNKENTPNSLADVVRMSPSPAPGLLRKGLMKTKSYTGSRENTLAANAIPAPQHVPWLETGAKANQEYLKARQDAFKHGGLRNKFLQSAAQAWNRNDARAAKALSLRGQSENDLMRKAHREAARLLYEERNRDSSSAQEVYVDLHGLHPEEAVEYLEHALIEHQNSGRSVYAITGTGHHSKNGKDKVGKAIRSWLSEWKYAYREFSVAGDNLGGILGVDPRSFDKSMLDERKEGTEGAKADKGSTGKIQLVKEIPTGPKKAG